MSMLRRGAGADRARRPHRRTAVARLGRSGAARRTSRVNATGTLNMLEAARTHTAPMRPFIFTSTNKVYGDRPNALPLRDSGRRAGADRGLTLGTAGIDVSMSIDASHSFSCSECRRLAADLLVQEYGRYFDMPTVCFRGGCLTGPQHAGAQLHGFLAYLMKCTVTGRAIHDLRLRRQAGPRQHSRARRSPRLSRVRARPESGGRLQPRRRPRVQRLDA